eukprot:TRINITY_DN9211_c0_g1_i1.p1 TRINITY_DN9211_c0_g1~~TRINITY_DN9211_c0_g1_i1.p1  ORF type:complete len:200 (+),score=29.65 TRINITY_DN9211_c0_g1_i1:22-621(+)
MKRNTLPPMNDSSTSIIEEYTDDSGVSTAVIPEKDHFPLCIVWTPLPLLTWFIPIIGHLGIVTSSGEINDFAGPYYVNRHPHEMGFGVATKYWRVKASDIPGASADWVRQWDDAVQNASCQYDKEVHNLICNNCHSHVAVALNQLKFKNITYWNTLMLIIYMSLNGKFVSWGRFLQTYAGFFIILVIAVVVAIIARVGK